MHELPGIAFEKAVASIQAGIDPSSTVDHNQRLVDRLGQSRQFDIVVRGIFAGQQMLGIIECKDLGKKAGTPEVDAFVTKAQDVNANFKILMSRKGFTKPALAKCSHYGIQALSLLEDDPINRSFFVGTRWTADVANWDQIHLELHFAEPVKPPVTFAVRDVKLGDRRVVDWFTNYLVDNNAHFSGAGWMADVTIAFKEPQLISPTQTSTLRCSGVRFKAFRGIKKLQRIVGLNGNGFFNWNLQQAIFPPGEITTDSVPMDMRLWSERNDKNWRPTGFVEVHLDLRNNTFPVVPDALDLMSL